MNYLILFFRFLKYNNLYIKFIQRFNQRTHDFPQLNKVQTAIKNNYCDDKRIAEEFLVGTFYWGDDHSTNWSKINTKYQKYLRKARKK
jgi:hypothetical protein